MIGGANNRGTVSGVGALERADDVTVYAERTEDGRHELRFTKRRWKPCESARARGAGKITPGRRRRRPCPRRPSPPSLPPRRRLTSPASSSRLRPAGGSESSRVTRPRSVPSRCLGTRFEGWLAAVREARGELEGDGEEPPDLPPTIH